MFCYNHQVPKQFVLARHIKDIFTVSYKTSGFVFMGFWHIPFLGHINQDEDNTTGKNETFLKTRFSHH